MKVKRLLAAIMALVMVGSSLGGTIPVMADENDPTVRNPEGPTVLSNGAKLYKTAASVPGYANMWRVTLRIETPVIETKSDTVLVIDNSNSMSANGRIGEAVSAAQTLAQELLSDGNTTNRIAVVSFNGSVTTRVGFSHNYDDENSTEPSVKSAIAATSTLSAGTHTQAGMHTATELLKTSTADIKNIVLLSDGEPSYSYAFTSDALADDDNFVAYSTFGNNALQTSKDVAQSVFGDYSTRAGSGNGMRTCATNSYPCPKYYNHGNSAIAEAGYYKALKIGDLYTIAVEAGTNGEAILGEMASSSEHYYEADDGELDEVFDKITGKIMAAINSANVHDVMGEGVIVENAEHSTELDWKPKFTYDAEKKIYWAEYSYDVEANEHILDENSTDGFHPLNKNATLTYNNNQTGAFPVPYVKPFFVNVKKEIEGQTCTDGDCVFTFRIEHPEGVKATDYTVEAGKTHRIVEAFPIGNYSLTEIGTNANNPVKFENYLVSYTGNNFTINEQHADHIDVTIKNKYETVSVSATKTWDDGGDQDGLRKNYNNKLYLVVKDGNKNVAFAEITGEDNQLITISDLPKNRNGEPISYKIVEGLNCSSSNNGVVCRQEFDGNNGEISIDDDYTTEIGANNVITNTHEPATVKITVNKNWNDENNRDGLRTENKQVEFCVTGKVDGVVVYQKTCKRSSSLIDDIVIEFTPLPKFNNGKEINYGVEESEFIGYNAVGLPEDAFTVEDEESLNVTNNHTPAKVNILIKKVWDDDEDNDNLRPDEINVTLKGGDSDVPLTIKESDSVKDVCESWCVVVPNMYQFKQGQEIEYDVVEGTINGYAESHVGDAEKGFVITNTHVSELYNNTGEITVQKKWDGDGNDLARPASILLELHGEITNDEGEVISWLVDSPAEVSEANDWSYTFTKLPKNKDKKTIRYFVQESGIGNAQFGDNESTIIVYDGEIIKGLWTKSVAGFEVTNTWTEAEDEIIYDGAKAFYIKKVDEDYKPMEGVTFNVGDREKTTDSDGLASKSVPVTSTEKEESFQFAISEKETVEGYDLIEESATLTVSCTSSFTGADSDTLINTYTKTCTFAKTGSDKYAWDDVSKTLTVVNKRSLAESLTIKKTVTGVSASVLTDLEFAVTGPEDFGEKGTMTLKASEDCTISNGTITCKVAGRIPTGNYTVTEGNADVENFELTVSGDNDVEKKVEKDDEIVFEITNEYEVDRIMYYVDKIWEDAHDKDGERPEKLTINLLANGEIIDTIDLTMNDAYIIDEEDEDYVTGDIWGFVWEGLPYADEYAEVIVYTAEEILESDEYEQLEMYNDEYGTLFINYHELDDPCAEGGCGGDIIPPAPETGRFTGVRGGGNVTCENTLAAGLAVVMMTLIGVPILVTAAIRRKK